MICEPEGPNPQTSSCCCIRCHWTGAALGQCDHRGAELDITGALCSQVRMENIRVIPLCQQHWKNMWFMVNPRGSSNRGQITSSAPSWHHTDSRERLGEPMNDQGFTDKWVVQSPCSKGSSHLLQVILGWGGHWGTFSNCHESQTQGQLGAFWDIWTCGMWSVMPYLFFLPCLLVIYLLHPPGSGPGRLLWASAPPWEGKSSGSHLPAPTLCFRPDHLGTRSTNKLC